jgi:precorrin-2 dehydrogenase/sirohydrochlorin ferrochelatase
MIPLFVDCSGRRIVIFGGGAVATRKAAYFAGVADVTVVSRSFSQKLFGLIASRQKADVSALSDDDLLVIVDGAFLVIGALPDPALNNRIGRICKEREILFNNADGKEGDVILPAVTSGKNYTIAISTHGSSPALSRFIRERLEEEYPALDAMIALQERLREELKAREPDQAARNLVLWQVVHDRAIWHLLTRDPDAAWEQVASRYLHE